VNTDGDITIRWTAEGPAEIESTARAVRGLLAFLVVQGFAPATRARIGGAVAELLENVVRHAYPDGDGPYRLRAELAGRRLSVEVADDGAGFDATRFGGQARLEPACSGFARARALAEHLGIASRTGFGSSVTLEFAASSAIFGDERGIDLSELDYLEPALARRVLEQVRETGSGEPFHLSPALAVCVGRLLSAPRAASPFLANTRS
jgi:anti-sigma regulatory factor (Ser/Thr protein kinase)